MSNHYNDIYYEDLYQQYEEWTASHKKVLDFKQWEENLMKERAIKAEAYEEKRRKNK